MSIPALNEEGLLPPGVYDCTISELEDRFGHFQGTDQRVRLCKRLKEFIVEARRVGFVTAVIVDGSFVTNKDAPSDIDLILVVRADHFEAALRPFEYNVVSKGQVRRTFRFDLLVGQEGQPEVDEHIAFFGRVRGHPDRRKGMIRIIL